VRGVERQDNRRIISGIVHVLRAAAVGPIVPKPTDLTQQSTIGSPVGHAAASGRICFVNLLVQADQPRCR
jgi:hypothetical protein